MVMRPWATARLLVGPLARGHIRWPNGRLLEMSAGLRCTSVLGERLNSTSVGGRTVGKKEGSQDGGEEQYNTQVQICEDLERDQG